MRKDGPNYRFNAELRFEDKTLSGVSCALFLPSKYGEEVRIELYPADASQREELRNAGHFDLVGTIAEGRGKVSVVCEDVLSTGMGARFWGVIAEARCRANADRVVVTQHVEEENGALSSRPSFVRFWLTPNPLLHPWGGISLELNGNLIFTRDPWIALELPSGEHLAFKYAADMEEVDEGEILHRSQLVAEIDALNARADALDVIQNLLDQEVELLVLLASAAARTRTMCVGWHASDDTKIVSTYLRRVVPSSEPRTPEELIPRQHFQEFLPAAYLALRNSPYRQEVQAAIWALTYENAVFESSYLALFAAMEGLILSFRQQRNLEFSLPSDIWGGLRESLKENARLFLKPRGVESERRAAVYNALEGVNRVPLRFAYSRFCAALTLETEDLWPLLDEENGPSLSQIRNALIHGAGLPWLTHADGLMAAKEHLHWLLERAVLAIVGWSLGKAEVNQNTLSQYYFAHQRREEHIRALAEVIP